MVYHVKHGLVYQFKEVCILTIILPKQISSKYHFICGLIEFVMLTKRGISIARLPQNVYCVTVRTNTALYYVYF